MKLSEKIYYCRKKDGKSQEALAELIGVSRQSVSKWENGEAEPEIAKLKLLADAFGVTVDWLLSDEELGVEAVEAATTYDYYKEQGYTETGYTDSSHNSSGSHNTDWVDALPGAIGKLIKRFGWLFGVYMAVIGALFTGMGWLARTISRSMFNSFNKTTNSMFGGYEDFGGMGYYDDSFASMVNSSVSEFANNNPVTIMGGAIMVLGIVMIIVGVVLAIVLKKRSME